MEKKNNKNLNELIFNLYDNTYKSLNNISLDFIKMYYSQYQYLEKEILYLENNKPSTLFKNKYQNWLEEKTKFEKEKLLIMNKIFEEYKNL